MEHELETKICQNCKKDFIIEPEDFLFYEKIKVPAPTWCPECRMIRRMTWRNHRSLYKRNCFLCDKSVIGIYRDGIPVCCSDCWNSGKLDLFSYGTEYDFSKPFFEQWFVLLEKVPKLFAYKIGTLVNSDYTNYSLNNKNVYLSYSVIECEDTMYSESVDKSKNIFDCYNSKKLNNCSYNIDSEGNYNTHHAIRTKNCIDSFFVYDCVNCQNCFLSSNLRNKKFFYKNKQYSKEEYEKIISNLNLDSYENFYAQKKLFDELLKDKNVIHRFANIYNSNNVSGNDILNSRNVKNGFNVQDSENIRYSWRMLAQAKDCTDVQASSSGELLYETVASSFNSSRIAFSFVTLGSRECEYCFYIKNCNNCFGCFGLTNASYCVFNKQYSKEEYEILVEKIKKHMNEMPYSDKKGRIYKYGEFFPSEMSPFGYNETNAHDFFNLKREEAKNLGFQWTEKEVQDYKITKEANDLPDSILEVKDDILKEIISCPNDGNQNFQCTSAYKIVPNELQFYKQMKLPLPRFCPNCRHYQRLKYINPLKLWHRKCMNKGCNNEFETSYAPDRSEIVYCEDCYKKEVY
jgi:hypothetical protein